MALLLLATFVVATFSGAAFIGYAGSPYYSMSMATAFITASLVSVCLLCCVLREGHRRQRQLIALVHHYRADLTHDVMSAVRHAGWSFKLAPGVRKVAQAEDAPLMANLRPSMPVQGRNSRHKTSR